MGDMFTGIIQTVGQVKSRSGGALDVAAVLPGEAPVIGESVAINGVCLTVEAHAGGVFRFHVSPETFARTSLALLVSGSRVNMERALTLATRLGGHLVSGHVDTTCQLLARAPEGAGERWSFQLPPDFARYVAFKGSVTLDGISLTVADRGTDSFAVALIPHTLSATNLMDRKVGEPLNLEVDLMARYLETLLGERFPSPMPRLQKELW
jgi:riboflavin synthase